MSTDSPKHVLVSINGKPYTYLIGNLELQIGDRVEVPVRNRSTQGEVVQLGSDYNGPCKSVIKLVERKEESKNWREFVASMVAMGNVLNEFTEDQLDERFREWKAQRKGEK